METWFDKPVERRGSGARKWDDVEKLYGSQEVLPFWIADMDFQAPPEVVAALVRAAEHGVYGYPRRSPDFYLAAVNWLASRHGWTVEPEWVLNTPGVVPAIALAVQAFTRPGDRILIQPPVYPPFFSCIADNGRVLTENPLLVAGDGQYCMDFADLAEKAAGAKMMILSNPHNPGGRVWTEDELKKLAEICLDNDILMISDEIHSDLVYAGRRHVPLASLSPAIAARTITCIAPSKTFNIAGLATSQVIISDRAVRARYRDAVEALHLGGGNIFGIAGLEAAYQYGASWLDALLSYLEGNADFLTRYVQEYIPQIRTAKPQGTYLAWLDCRGLGFSQPELKNFFARRAKVGLNDGATFGRQGTGFMRMNFGCRRSLLAEGLDRIRSAVRGLG